MLNELKDDCKKLKDDIHEYKDHYDAHKLIKLLSNSRLDDDIREALICIHTDIITEVRTTRMYYTKSMCKILDKEIELINILKNEKNNILLSDNTPSNLTREENEINNNTPNNNQTTHTSILSIHGLQKIWIALVGFIIVMTVLHHLAPESLLASINILKTVISLGTGANSGSYIVTESSVFEAGGN